MKNDSDVQNLLQILSPISSPDDPDFRYKRRVGHHAIQIAVDTIAYAFNIPLQLILIDKLRNLPNTIVQLLEKEETKIILKNEAPDLDAVDYFRLGTDFFLARDWILQLANPDEPLPIRPDLPKGWEQGILILLPHIERQVWLTEISNPLPVDALCRMQYQWALYLLMWYSKQTEAGGVFDLPAEPITNSHQLPDPQVKEPETEHCVFTIEHFIIHRLNPFILADDDGKGTLCLPIAGPFFEISDTSKKDPHTIFRNRFNRFIQRVNESEWHSDALTPPNQDELIDAFAARMDLSSDESKSRPIEAHDALRMFLGATIDSDLVRSRITFETATMLIAWFARWQKYRDQCTESRILLRFNNSARLVLAERQGETWHLHIQKGNTGDTSIIDIDEILSQLIKKEDRHIDRLDGFVNRLLERRSAAWSTQIIAINNLLNRHASIVTKSNPNTFDSTEPKSTPNSSDSYAQPFSNRARAMLRGFGNQICRYLVSITRADKADVYWLDYSQTPPRLVHAGGFARLKTLRAYTEEICKTFDAWAWQEEKTELANNKPCPASLRQNSSSQAYRVAATASEEPQPVDGRMGVSNKRKKVIPYQENISPRANESVDFFDGFPDDAIPRDAMAQPLLVNGRVVGVLTFHGLIDKQFDARLFMPIRRAASLIAICMYHQSQLEHIGQLNSLFAHDAISLRQYNQQNEFNPLKDVSRFLSNIFLCPVVHLWLCSKENENRFELYGYNWQGIFQGAGSLHQEFTHDPNDAERNPSDCAFSALAIDLWQSERGEHKGSFVQGYFDYKEEKTKRFNATEASTLGCILGNDIFALPTFKSYRQKIFKQPPEGYALLNIMSFPLYRQKQSITASNSEKNESSVNDDENEIVGIVTLHDWGYTCLEGNVRSRSQPWDSGWRTVVKHMQTNLPYLLTQAEILDNQLMDARRYLIHAGRAELIGVLDSTYKLKSSLNNVLAPDRGLRRIIDEVLSDNFKGDYREKLWNSQITLEQTWQSILDAASPIWEENLSQLINVMQEYRNLSMLGVSIVQANESINIKEQIEKILQSYQNTLRRRGIWKEVEIAENVFIRMPLLWFRIIFADLIHNAAKYATSGRALEIMWKNQILSIQNEGTYRSDLDNEQRLLMAGKRGSAARFYREIESLPNSIIKRSGQGLGLWGAKLICGLVNIKMDLNINPLTNSLKDNGGVLEGRAIYTITLTIPRIMVEKTIPAGNDFF